MKVVLATFLISVIVTSVLSDDLISRNKRTVRRPKRCRRPAGEEGDVKIYQCPGTPNPVILTTTCTVIPRSHGRRWQYRHRPRWQPRQRFRWRPRKSPRRRLKWQPRIRRGCKIVCGQPLDGIFTQAVLLGTSVINPDSYSYECLDGYMTNVESLDSKCRADGTFSFEPPPICAPKLCGPPPPVTGANDVVSGSLSFGQCFTYECETGYSSTGGSLTVTCLATGLFSAAPTCTANMCTVPTLANGQTMQAPGQVAVGTSVDFTCVTGFRFAPSNPPNPAEVQTVTCQSGGTFTAFTKTCVSVNPTSCKDYFTRDNLFSASADGVCMDVDIGLSNPIKCCKKENKICTEIRTTTTTPYSPPAGACTQTTTNVFPGATFDPPSRVCGASDHAVTYTLTDTEIAGVVTTADNAGGTCSQKTTIDCTSPFRLSLGLRFHSQTSGSLYGSNAFTSLNINPSAGITAGEFCKCGIANEAGCANGCRCSSPGTPGPSGQDIITNIIGPASANLKYVNILRVAQHFGFAFPLEPNSFIVTVGPVECCESP